MVFNGIQCTVSSWTARTSCRMARLHISMGAYVSQSMLRFSVEGSRSRFCQVTKDENNLIRIRIRGIAEWINFDPWAQRKIPPNVNWERWNGIDFRPAIQHVCRCTEKWFEHHTFSGNEPPGWLMIIILMTKWITIIISYSNMKMILCQQTQWRYRVCSHSGDSPHVNVVCLLCRIINCVLSVPDHSNVSFSYKFVCFCCQCFDWVCGFCREESLRAQLFGSLGTNNKPRRTTAPTTTTTAHIRMRESVHVRWYENQRNSKCWSISV